MVILITMRLDLLVTQTEKTMVDLTTISLLSLLQVHTEKLYVLTVILPDMREQIPIVTAVIIMIICKLLIRLIAIWVYQQNVPTAILLIRVGRLHPLQCTTNTMFCGVPMRQ